MWDGEPPNHRTVPQTHDIFSTLHNLDYKGPTEEGYVGASTTGKCYNYFDYNPKHTHVLGGNTSAHTRTGGNISAHTRAEG